MDQISPDATQPISGTAIGVALKSVRYSPDKR